MSRHAFSPDPPSRRPSTTATWTEQVRNITRHMATTLRQRHPADPTYVHRHIIEAARQALGDAPGHAMYRDQTVDAAGQSDIAMTTTGVFRLILVDHDRYRDDAVWEESFMDAIQRILDEVLDRPVGPVEP